MKISEMILKLQEIKEEHGDIPMCLEHEGSHYLIEKETYIHEGMYEHSPYDHHKRTGIQKKGKFLCL